MREVTFGHNDDPPARARRRQWARIELADGPATLSSVGVALRAMADAGVPDRAYVSFGGGYLFANWETEL